MEEAMRLHATLRAETDFLRRKQQRKGVEYRIKEAPDIPHIQLDDFGQAKPEKKRPDSGSLGSKTLRSTGKMAMSTTFSGTKTAGAGLAETRASAAAATVDLNEYDPKALAEKEHSELSSAVSNMRQESSDLRHEITTLQKGRDELQSELIKLEYEDAIEDEREAGMREIDAQRSANEALTGHLADAEAYRYTLEHMLNRCRREKVDTKAIEKAFEEALSVHRHELGMKQGLLETVIKSRDRVLAELHRMQEEVTTKIADMDKKLEARRGEVKVRQEKARWIQQKLAQEFTLQAHVGNVLTPEMERQLIEQAKNISQEAAELRGAKLRAMAEADAAESEYHRLRFAAGVSTPAPAEATSQARPENPGQGAPGANGDDEGLVTETLSYVPPDPDAVLARFAQVEVEMQQLEEQTVDYNQRIQVLTARVAQLKAVRQPKARDVEDEVDTDLSHIEALRRRGEAARRALDVATSERKEADTMKLQLLQSVTLLASKLAHIVAPLPEVPDWGVPSLQESEATVQALLTADRSAVPTPWCADLHEKLSSAVTNMQLLHRIVDLDEASTAFTKAKDWLQESLAGSVLGVGKQAATEGDQSLPPSINVGATQFSSSPAPTPGGSGLRIVRRSSAIESTLAAGGFVEDAVVREEERGIDSAIDQLVTQNAYSVRVRPSSGQAAGVDGSVPALGGTNSGLGRTRTGTTEKEGAAHKAHAVPPQVQTAKLLADAAHMFEKSLSGANHAENAKSRAAAAASEAAEPDGVEQEEEDVDVEGDMRLTSQDLGRGGRVRSAGASTAASSGQGKGAAPGSVVSGPEGSSKTAPSYVKPRPRELHRLLAAALQMSGDDVDDHLLQDSSKPREADDVVTRDQVKRTTKVNIRQYQKALKASKDAVKAEEK